jgi:DNA-binding response OmpR family regulator
VTGAGAYLTQPIDARELEAAIKLAATRRGLRLAAVAFPPI